MPVAFGSASTAHTSARRWCGVAAGSVTRIDPDAGATTQIEAGVPGDGGDLTAGGGSVWARGTGPLLTRIDARTNRVIKRYGPSSGSGGVIVGGGAVWVSAHDVNTVWRLPLDAH